MLLKDILLIENEQEVHLPEYLVEYLHEHCQPYLQAVGNDLTKLMYRGISRNRLSRLNEIPGMLNCAYIPGSNDERIPRNSKQSVHDKANELFTQYYGAPFRNGVFVTGKKISAGKYGTPVAVFPIGEFKYCWSKSILDMYIATPPGDKPKDELYEKIKHSYQTTDLPAGIRSNNEIMLYCDSCLVYVAV